MSCGMTPNNFFFQKKKNVEHEIDYKIQIAVIFGYMFIPNQLIVVAVHF